LLLGIYNVARASAGDSIITPYNIAVITTNVISINNTRRTRNFNIDTAPSGKNRDQGLI
jgi:hypothetical protein